MKKLCWRMIVIFAVTLSVHTHATWSWTNPMEIFRESSSSGVLLPDGRVVFVSGNQYMCQGTIYSPDTETWERTGPIPACPQSLPATLLNDGRVLSIGAWGGERWPAAVLEGSPLAWRSVQAARLPHRGTTLTTLASGAVFLIGGSTNEYEIFDPVTEEWTCCGTLTMPRTYHTATLLTDGRLLVVGGNGSLRTAEIYDPSTDTWTLTGPLVEGRTSHAAVLLSGGQVLVVGGAFSTTAEIFDPITQSWSPVATTQRRSPILYPALVALPSGGALLAGGGTYIDGITNEVEIYDPSSRTWISAPHMGSPRSNPLAVGLLDGRVLAAGGENGSECFDRSCTPTFTATAEIFEE